MFTVLLTGLLLVTMLYCLNIARMTIGLQRIPKHRDQTPRFISVIIAVRNEEAGLASCLRSLAAQDYPSGMHEIIIADDRSTDGTPAIIRQFCETQKNFSSVRVEESEQNAIPKKSALRKALAVARGEIIAETDGDCIVPETWLSSMNAYFSDNVGMVVGHTEYPRPANGWQGIDAIDYFSQRALGAAFIGAGSAYTSTASNFAYRKAVYEANKEDFAALGVRPAEDNYFLQCVHSRSKYAVAVATDKKSFVSTRGAHDLRHFLNQRFRWSAYGGMIATPAIKLFFIPALLYFFFVWIGAATVVVNVPHAAPVLAVSILCKLTVDFIFMVKATSLFGCGYLLKYFPHIFLVHFVLIPLIVVKGNLSTFEWKGRKYTKVKEVAGT